MPQKFYIAASFKEKQTVNYLAEALKSHGLQRTYDWTKNQRTATLSDLTRIGEEEYRGVSESDFLLFIFPAGKGANIEFGIAAGLKKPIYIFDKDGQINDFENTSTFYFLDNVTRCSGDLNEFIDFVLEKELKQPTVENPDI